MSNRDLICQAIRKKQRISFSYHGKNRKGEPQCCGVTTASKEGARIYLLEGGRRPEQLFTLSEIESLTLIDEFFDKPGPNYKKNDSAMKEIFCQL
jgi:predicted DNA-binding transcriptional regulator YafY